MTSSKSFPTVLQELLFGFYLGTADTNAATNGGMQLNAYTRIRKGIIYLSLL
jgi:hypothetical protein